MQRLDEGAWVLVADGGKALILENRGTRASPDLSVRDEMRNDNPPTHAQGTDTPGRRAGGGEGSRSGMEEADFHRIGEERFARDLGRVLSDAALRGEFAKIVLVAAPRFLGDLRRALHPSVASRVVAEVPKTLTNRTVADITRIVLAEVEASGG